MMKSIFAPVALWMTLVLSVASAFGVAAPDFTVNIRLASDVVKTGSPVNLTVLLANTTDHQIFVPMLEPEELNFRVDVRASDGTVPGK